MKKTFTIMTNKSYPYDSHTKIELEVSQIEDSYKLHKEIHQILNMRDDEKIIQLIRYN